MTSNPELIEAIAAGVVGVGLLWLVLQPMLSPATIAPPPFEPLDPEETPRGLALLALKEIEFDRATGKLSDEDYAELTTKYSAAAIATLDAPTASTAPTAPVSCRTHGARAEPDAAFCAECGAGLVTESGACANCGFAVPADAGYCAGCGLRLS